MQAQDEHMASGSIENAEQAGLAEPAPGSVQKIVEELESKIELSAGEPRVTAAGAGIPGKDTSASTTAVTAVGAGSKRPLLGAMAPPPFPLPPRATLLSRLNQEIQTVLALIQQNAAWAGAGTTSLGLRLSIPPRHTAQVVPVEGGEAGVASTPADAEGGGPAVPRLFVILDADEEEDELAGEELVALELRLVRARMFSWPDWATVEPLAYLMPFLYAIRSPLTSTPVTASALLSVHNILTTGFFSVHTAGAALAMHVLVDSITSCRFEVRDVLSEELVLMRILNVLLAALQCPAAPLLSDRAVCTVVNTCFRVLHQSAAKGELLQRMAAHVMREMIRTIFARLPALAAAEAAAGALSPEAEDEEEDAEEAVEVAAGAPRPQGDRKGGAASHQDSGSAEEKKPLLKGSGPQGQRRRGEGGEESGEEWEEGEEEVGGEGAEEGEEEEVGEEEEDEGEAAAGEEGEYEGRQGEGEGTEALAVQAKGVLVEVGAPQGMNCMVEIFQFLCSLLSVEDQYGAPLHLGGGASEVGTGEDDNNVPLFALQLLACALELGGETVGEQPRLMTLVQDSLLRSLLHLACTSPSLPMIALVCNTVLHLYLTLRTKLKLQLEAFFDFALVRLVQEKYAVSPQHQEVALEALVDLCRLPSFAAEMYANFDCDLASSNTFEDVCSQLSRASFPVTLPLTRLHVLALRGLLALLHHMSQRVDAGPAPKPPPPTSLKSQDPQHYQLLWTSKVPNPDKDAGPAELEQWVAEVRRRKHIKRRLMLGAEQFNRDPARGLLYLQSYHLLPPELDPRSVACFLRYTPGVNKTVLGTFLGDHDQFKVDVLSEFVRLFDFERMTLDAALRIFLESFRLPGEAQKISRILEAFADRYFEQCRTILANRDAAYILAYSVIMLNTDQHNGQVRQKMTEEEFIRNNRSINDGKDLPRRMLSGLYHSIARDEIRVSSEASPGHLDMPQSRWAEILRRAATGEVGPYVTCMDRSSLLDYDMFAIIAGPTVAAISVVFDNAEEEEVLRQCVAGFLDAAKVCAAHCMRDTLDDLVVSLCKFTTLLEPRGGREERGDDEEALALELFAADLKARLAAGAVFTIASRYGDYVRTGWRNILDCMLRLHKMGLLPARVLQEARDAWSGEPTEEEEDAERARKGAGTGGGGEEGGEEGGGAEQGGEGQVKARVLTTLALSRAQGIAVGRRRGRGFMSRVSQLLLGGAGGGYDELPQAAEEAQRQVLESVREWHIEAIFADSKFLQADSLLHLAKALIWAASRAQGTGGSGPYSPVDGIDRAEEDREDEDTAVFCLDLLFGVTLANRDRISLLWPAVAEHLSAVFLTAVPPPTVLLDKAVLGMLHVCQRLLAYKEDVVDELLRSLQLVLKLDSELAAALCPRVTQQVLLLVQSYCSTRAQVQSAPAWRTLFLLLTASARHPTAADVGLEALRFVLAEPRHVTKTNFLPCLDLATGFAAASTPGPAALKRAVKAMDLLGPLAECLVGMAQEDRDREAAGASGSAAGMPAAPSTAEADALVTGGGWVVVQRVPEGGSRAIGSGSGDYRDATGAPGVSPRGGESGPGRGEAQGEGGEGVGEAGVVDLWVKLVASIARACAAEHRESVRSAGIASLKQALGAASRVGVPGPVWAHALERSVFRLTEDVLHAATAAAEKKPRSGGELRPIDASLELLLQLQCQAVVGGPAGAALGVALAVTAVSPRTPGGSGDSPAVKETEGEGVSRELLTKLWLHALDSVGRYVNGPPRLPDERIGAVGQVVLRPALASALSSSFLTPAAEGAPGGTRANTGAEGVDRSPSEGPSSRWAATWTFVSSLYPELTPESLLSGKVEGGVVQGEATQEAKTDGASSEPETATATATTSEGVAVA